MESVALDPGVFIRSMASRGSLGGLATTTREITDLLDAAGFARILVETVGVGQSELDVARMADTTVLVLVPESGDGIQTLKSGLMEAADLYVVNKADRPGAEKLRQEIEVTLGIRRGNAYRHVPAHHGRAAGQAGRAGGARQRGSRRSCSPAPRRARGWTQLIAALDRHHAWLTEIGRARPPPPGAARSRGRVKSWIGRPAGGCGKRRAPTGWCASGSTRSRRDV